MTQLKWSLASCPPHPLAIDAADTVTTDSMRFQVRKAEIQTPLLGIFPITTDSKRGHGFEGEWKEVWKCLKGGKGRERYCN